MKLIVRELTPSVYQTLTPTRNTFVAAIRPHLYLHNKPTGLVTVRITNDLGETIATSETIDVSTITTATYYHGYIRFYITASLMKNTKYRIYVEATSYTYLSTKYIAVCNDYDLRKYQPTTPVLAPAYAPLDIEIWERERNNV